MGSSLVFTIEQNLCRDDFGLELKTVLAKAQVDVSTYMMPQIVIGEGNIVFHWEWDNLNWTTTNVHGNAIVNSACGIILTNMLPIVQVIDKNKLRWFGHGMRREEESMLWGCDALNDERKETKGRQY